MKKSEERRMFSPAERSVTSRHHGSTISGWQQNQQRLRRKENGKKVKGFYWQNNKFARASRYFVHFFAVVEPGPVARTPATWNFLIIISHAHFME